MARNYKAQLPPVVNELSTTSTNEYDELTTGKVVV